MKLEERIEIPILRTVKNKPQKYVPVLVEGGVAFWDGTHWRTLMDEGRAIQWHVDWYSPLVCLGKPACPEPAASKENGESLSLDDPHSGKSDVMTKAKEVLAEPKLPDPGEGYELCSYESAEHYKFAGLEWVPLSSLEHPNLLDGLLHPSVAFRRRTLVTEPPSVEAVGDDENCWAFTATKGHDSDGFAARYWWHTHIAGKFIAWTPALPGETEPPEHIREAAALALVAERIVKESWAVESDDTPRPIALSVLRKSRWPDRRQQLRLVCVGLPR